MPSDDSPESQSSYVRPFLGRIGATPPAGPGAPAPAASAAPADVRPYFLTSGRVASADGRVRVETMVLARPGAAHRLPPQAREHRRLVALAADAHSVVELAVAMGVPVGVALVLVGDLVREGLLDISSPAVAPRDDVELIRRLIDGVCAL